MKASHVSRIPPIFLPRTPPIQHIQTSTAAAAAAAAVPNKLISSDISKPTLLYFIQIHTNFLMCKSKKMVSDVVQPKRSQSHTQKSSNSPHTSGRNSDHLPGRRSQLSLSDPSTSGSSNNNNSVVNSGNYTTSASYNLNNNYSWQSSVSISSRTSLSSLRDSLPENPHIYEFSEICAATSNFLSKHYSSSSSSASWKCQIRGNEVLVIQRKLRRPVELNEVREHLALICKSHHKNLIKLRGASISGYYIYLVYDFVQGANLADCLRNPKNPNFTVLTSWMSRIQIASDLAHGLDYIHNSTGLNLSFVHNHIKSSSIVVTEPNLNAKICHFGTAELCGEIEISGEIKEERFKRSSSRLMKFQGTRGYMSPEFQSTGIATEKSDVYAFGVVILELLSGSEPLRFIFDGDGDGDGGYRRVSVIETAREAVEAGGIAIRRWVDKRLKDSFPVEVAEKLARVGLDCVEEDPDKRPYMGWVVGRISKMYLESQTWADKLGSPTDFISVSVAPR